MVCGREARDGGHRRARRHRPHPTGETFEIHTEVDSEIIVSLFGGIRHRFGERWFGEFTLSADQHFASWESEDRISGATGGNGDYFAYGFHLGIGYRFE
jgi:hypothetical protein